MMTQPPPPNRPQGTDRPAADNAPSVDDAAAALLAGGLEGLDDSAALRRVLDEAARDAERARPAHHSSPAQPQYDDDGPAFTFGRSGVVNRVAQRVPKTPPVAPATRPPASEATDRQPPSVADTDRSDAPPSGPPQHDHSDDDLTVNLAEQDRDGNVVTIDMFAPRPAPSTPTGTPGAEPITPPQDDAHTYVPDAEPADAEPADAEPADAGPATDPSSTSDAVEPTSDDNESSAPPEPSTTWDSGVYEDRSWTTPEIASDDIQRTPGEADTFTPTPEFQLPDNGDVDDRDTAAFSSPFSSSTPFTAGAPGLTVEEILRGSPGGDDAASTDFDDPNPNEPPSADETKPASGDSERNATPDDDPYDSTRATTQQRHARPTPPPPTPPSPAEEPPASDGATPPARTPLVVRTVNGVKSGSRAAATPYRAVVGKLPEGMRPYAKLAVIGVVAIVLVAFVIPSLLRSGGNSDSPSASDPSTPAVAGPTAADPAANPADGVIAVPRENVTADCANGSTSPALVLSTASQDAWRCMRYFSSDGVTLEIRFSKPVTISQIQFVPGWNYVEPSVDNWTKWRVLKEVLWVVGEDQYPQSITPTRGGVTQRFNPPVSTTVLKMIVQQTEQASGGKNNNALGGSWSSTEDGFAVSHMRIYGRDSQ